MRKQRFTAVQKMAAEKKMQIDGAPGPSEIPRQEPLPPPRTSTLGRPAPPSRSSVGTNFRRNYIDLFNKVIQIISDLVL